ncbi:Vacuolar ABC heavy metal transporter (H.t1.c1) [Penicillium sp. IBT 16267x]|nr:Vacuolar ABC heavy metal transporter (H.t1.c1) [Penicillium sp. IBT 16267x]
MSSLLYSAFDRKFWNPDTSSTTLNLWFSIEGFSSKHLTHSPLLLTFLTRILQPDILSKSLSVKKAVAMELQSAYGLLETLRTFYFIILILLFNFVSMVETVVAMKKAKKNDTGLGPDTCPCQQNKRNWMALKGYFVWLSTGVLMTYIVDTLTYIIHVTVAWSEHWWGGESMASPPQQFMWYAD